MPGDIGCLRPCADFHLNAYTDPSSKYAFTTYDQWYDSPDRLTPLDCFAANLLNLNLRHSHVIPMFSSTDTPATRLRKAIQRVLDETTGNDHFLRLPTVDSHPFALVRAANTATEDVDEWTAVTVCKVLHRLRPDLVPLYDSVVRDHYEVSSTAPGEFFRRFHENIRNNELWLADLAYGYRTPDNRPLSVLRAADVVIWHHKHEGGCGNAGC